MATIAHPPAEPEVRDQGDETSSPGVIIGSDVNRLVYSFNMRSQLAWIAAQPHSFVRFSLQKEVFNLVSLA